MTALTSPDNIVIWTTSDPASLVAESAAQAASIQAALTSISGVRGVYSFVFANAAARNAETRMQAGSASYQQDNKQYYRYDGTAWRLNSVGLVPIVPSLSSASSGVVTTAANGRVAVNQVPSTLRLDGLFTSDFANYRVIIDVESLTTANNVSLQFSAAGVVDAGAVYDAARNFNNATTASSAVGSAVTSAPITAVGGTRIGVTLDLTPATGQRKTFWGTAFAAVAAGTPVLTAVGGQSRTTTATDGLNIVMASALATAGSSLSVSVFGYNNG